MLLISARILGGDASFYYLGSYSSADGRWKGEIVNQEHTPAKDENPVFGGHEVEIGFSGACDADSAELTGIALAGKRSLRLAAKLKPMRPVWFPAALFRERPEHASVRAPDRLETAATISFLIMSS